MERFLPILDRISVRLREILTESEDCMLSWDFARLKRVGDELIRLSTDIYPQLSLVGHRVLYQSIREAGLGIKMRVMLIEKREINEEDKEYFRSVHETLSYICQKIESGEYYRALLDVARKKGERDSVEGSYLL
ncbi:MAG: hypothetical protein QW600_01785 [Candidatus Bathyarchaeia archaeon]|nr:hypothetical protein [Candidatus Bathyarchaeota archaeon]